MRGVQNNQPKPATKAEACGKTRGDRSLGQKTMILLKNVNKKESLKKFPF